MNANKLSNRIVNILSTERDVNCSTLADTLEAIWWIYDDYRLHH